MIPKYGFHLTRNFSNKDRKKVSVRENPYSGMFYAVAPLVSTFYLKTSSLEGTGFTINPLILQNKMGIIRQDQI